MTWHGSKKQIFITYRGSGEEKEGAQSIYGIHTRGLEGGINALSEERGHDRWMEKSCVMAKLLCEVPSWTVEKRAAPPADPGPMGQIKGTGGGTGGTGALDRGHD